eukprot:7493545-Pyramimonas_sp.AAC.1
MVRVPYKGSPFRMHWREGGKIFHPWVSAVTQIFQQRKTADHSILLLDPCSCFDALCGAGQGSDNRLQRESWQGWVDQAVEGSAGALYRHLKEKDAHDTDEFITEEGLSSSLPGFMNQQLTRWSNKWAAPEDPIPEPDWLAQRRPIPITPAADPG